MRKWTYLVLTALLFLSLAMPVLADSGQGQVAFPGGSIVVKPGDEIREDVAVLGGSLELREGGRIHGGVTILGGSGSIDGEITGDLVVLGGKVELRSHAVIAGNLVTMGATVSQAEGAVIQGERIEGFQGQIPHLSLPSITPFPWSYARPTQGYPLSDWFSGATRALVNALALMVLGMLLVSFVPKQTHLVGQTVVSSPWMTLGIGLLTMLALPVVVVILVLICIGIPVAILLVLLAVAAGLFGWLAIAEEIGQRTLSDLKAQPTVLLQVVVGVGLLALLTSVPCLGWLLWLCVASAGLGAVVLTRFGTLPYVPRGPATAPSTPITPILPLAPVPNKEQLVEEVPVATTPEAGPAEETPPPSESEPSSAPPAESAQEEGNELSNPTQS